MKKATQTTFTNHFVHPIHYFGNEFLSLPDKSGHMYYNDAWLVDMFTVIAANAKNKKYKTCYEPFAGSASWTLAAMQHNFAEKYIINDSDPILIRTLQLIKNAPNKIKKKYTRLLQNWNSTDLKDEFFVKAASAYNNSDLDAKAFLLPFIVNHAWGGILYHDRDGRIIASKIDGKDGSITKCIHNANLTVNQFCTAVDKISWLLNCNEVTFCSGDFENVLANVTNDDFVILDPPYPENTRYDKDNKKITMYQELYAPTELHDKLVQLIGRLDDHHVPYFMTYGLYNPEMKNFEISDGDKPQRRYFYLLGYKECAFGQWLDQVYFSPLISVPEDLESKFTKAEKLLSGHALSSEQALKVFLEMTTATKMAIESEKEQSMSITPGMK